MKKRLASFRFAFRGVAFLIATQPNARVHLTVTFLVIGLGSWLGVSRLEWACLVLAMGGVWGLEALNTALEQLADRTAPERHPLVRNAKDAAAAAVLLWSVAAAIVGLLILGPQLWIQLFG